MKLNPFSAWNDDDISKPETRSDIPPYTVKALRKFYAMLSDLTDDTRLHEAEQRDENNKLDAEQCAEIAAMRMQILEHGSEQFRELLESLKLVPPSGKYGFDPRQGNLFCPSPQDDDEVPF